ncbi:hypothetical protein [Mesotoga sp. BH458_6_3_2_1]|uniref:hypothetical protein n=1 Tax=Mesotoga sp. BH458_6_3_2_1 TaxID=1437446 RepID=UPI0016024528|nr:hypothetical protein [Mesotoga sp. BH458_6_3_2_1]
MTNEEQILPLEQIAIFSSLTSALLGERWTVDGQRSLHQRAADLTARFRAGPSLDNRRGVEQVRLYGMTMSDNYAILLWGRTAVRPKEVLVGISAFYAN